MKKRKKLKIHKATQGLPSKIIGVLKENRVVITNCALIAFAALCLFFSGTDAGRSVLAAAAKRDLPIYCVDTEDKKLAISFDAAWGNEDTAQLIEILDKYKIQATFFVVGDWVRKYPESVKQLFDAGHEIMSHSDKHKHMTQLSREEIIADIEKCGSEIEKVTGVKPTLFRPPYGEYDNKLIETLRGLGYFTIQWNVDSLDWKDLPPKDISSRVLGKLVPGSIVLFHNAAKNTPAALPSIIENALSQGYSFVKISDIIYKDGYTIDHAGKQILSKN